MDPTEQYQVGEIVALVSREGSGNGAGEGILWQVTDVRNIGGQWQKLTVKPRWCATGWCSLRPKKVFNSDVRQRIPFVRLGELRVQLEALCREALAREAGLQPEEETV